MPAILSARELRDLIADSVAAYRKSYEVEAFCVSLGLAPATEGEDPWHSKRVYVRGKLVGIPVEELRTLGRKVSEELGDDALAEQLGHGGPRGVDGELKNIVFASIGPKPRIVMTDALNNVIDIVENASSCLVYDRPLSSPGLTWSELTSWWGDHQGSGEPAALARGLYQRLSQSLASPPERTLFRTYCKRYGDAAGPNVPALLPQVYLHYDPYTRAERTRKTGEIKRERMDFLLLLPNRARIVLEVDGKQHYSDELDRPSPARYAEMMAEDRRIRIRGYEVYRFGGAELMRADAEQLLDEFFDLLLAAHPE